MTYATKTNVENINQYCSKCGRNLIRVQIPAEKLHIIEFIGYDIDMFPLGEKYNPKTGLRQFGIKIMCPKAKWYNSHTRFVDENSLHDVDFKGMKNKKSLELVYVEEIYWYKDGIVDMTDGKIKIYRNGKLADTGEKWEQLIILKEKK